jgi:SAM-dependent methyltransferase
MEVYHKYRGSFFRIFGTDLLTAELGVHQGEFSPALWKISKKMYLVDIWWLQGEQSWDKSDSFENYFGVVNKFRKELVSGEVEIHVERDLQFLERFPDHHFDLLYLDTTHTYKDTKRELAAMYRKTKPGGHLTGHDYNFIGVGQAIHEFLPEHPECELLFTDNWMQWAIKIKESPAELLG